MIRQGKASILSGRRDLWLTVGLIVVALFHRIAFLFSNEDRDWGFSIFYEGDAEKFHQFATALNRGDLYDGGIPFHPPGWPYLLAAIYRILGIDGTTQPVPSVQIKLIMALFGALVIGLIYRLVRPYLGVTIAIITSLGCAYHFGLYVFSVTPVSETLFQLCLFSVLLMWTRLFADNAKIAGQQLTAAGLGIGLGMLALVRAEGVLIGLLLIGFAVVLNRTAWRRHLGLLCLIVAGWLLVIAPWTIRNYNHLCEINHQYANRLAQPLPTFVPITAYGPLNLALANNATADGTFSRAILQSNQGSALNLFYPPHLNLFLHGEQAAWRFATTEPGRFARLVTRKWQLMFGALRVGWTQWNLPAGLSGVRRPIDIFVPHSVVVLSLLGPLILFGLIRCLMAGGLPRQWAMVVLLLTLHTMIVTGLFFGYSRLGLICLPCWLSLAAVGGRDIYRLIAMSLGKIQRFDYDDDWLSKRQYTIIFFVVLVLLGAEIWGATGVRQYKTIGTPLAGTNRLNPDAAMEIDVLH